MRKHNASHILIDKLENVCGFCGVLGCSINIVKGSGKGKIASKSVSSNCEYSVKFSLIAAETSTKSSRCTNRPLTFKFCNMVEWSYNMKGHMKRKHIDHPSDEWVVQLEEVNSVKEV